eukprot:304554-Alexandrium_andersonii.AAC.1
MDSSSVLLSFSSLKSVLPDSLKRVLSVGAEGANVQEIMAAGGHELGSREVAVHAGCAEHVSDEVGL